MVIEVVFQDTLGVFSLQVQCPNLPAIGYAQSILTRDSQGRDSFTKDTLLSASEQLLLAQLFTSNKEGL